MEWLNQNAGTIWLVVTSVVTIASAVAALTPSKKDDRILGKVGALIDALALNWGYAKRK